MTRQHGEDLQEQLGAFGARFLRAAGEAAVICALATGFVAHHKGNSVAAGLGMGVLYGVIVAASVSGMALLLWYLNDIGGFLDAPRDPTASPFEHEIMAAWWLVNAGIGAIVYQQTGSWIAGVVVAGCACAFVIAVAAVINRRSSG